MGYIYKVTNLINGKIYIGQTSRTIEKRWQEHLWDAHNHHNNCSLHSAIRKYSKSNFLVEKVIECDNDNLNDYEKYWISFYQSNNKHKGYNLTDGGDSNFKKNPDSEITKQKKSFAQTGENNSFYGKHHSANHRANISTPIVAYTDDGMIYMYYISQISANKDGYQQSHITDCVNGKHKHHGKTKSGQRLCWRFATNDECEVIRLKCLNYGVESLTPSVYKNFTEEYSNGNCDYEM